MAQGHGEGEGEAAYGMADRKQREKGGPEEEDKPVQSMLPGTCLFRSDPTSYWQVSYDVSTIHSPFKSPAYEHISVLRDI